jgi:hypothetical protein
MRGLEIQYRQAHLALIALAMSPASRIPSGRNRRQKKSHQDPDDGDHDQQLYERERAVLIAMTVPPQARSERNLLRFR